MEERGPVTLNGNIPYWLKIIMIFIDRVGFPILAFCLMFWMCYQSIGKVSIAISDNTEALNKMTSTSEHFQRSVTTDHADIKRSLLAIHENSYGKIQEMAKKGRNAA